MTDIITVAFEQARRRSEERPQDLQRRGHRGTGCDVYSDDFCDFRIDTERRSLTTNKAEQIARDGSGAIEQESALVP